MSATPLVDPTVHLRMHVREFGIPPIRDGLVLGKTCPVGCVAMRKALTLLSVSPYVHIEFEDDTISDVLVREPLLRKVPQEKLIAFIVDRVKPLMTSDEIMDFDLEAEVVLEGPV